MTAIVCPSLMLSGSNAKDSRWLTLDVCREYVRNKCSRSDEECKFAHPTANVEIQNGRVVCCFDSIKGKCQRREPPCKYLHPPQHLKEQLLQNGRNNLLMRHMIQTQLLLSTRTAPAQTVYPVVYDINANKNSHSPSNINDAYMQPTAYIVQNGPAYTQMYNQSRYGLLTLAPLDASSYTATNLTEGERILDDRNDMGMNQSILPTTMVPILKNEILTQPQPQQQQQQPLHTNFYNNNNAYSTQLPQQQNNQTTAYLPYPCYPIY